VRKTKKTPTRKVVDTLIEELEGIKGELPASIYLYDHDEEDDEAPLSENGTISSEQIEVALSGLVSSISEALGLPVEPGSLSELLEALFSSDDDSVSLALNLEDAVNGYFGELFGENLDLAETYFTELIELLKEKRKKWKPQRG
jgi:hypothetical protein